MAAVMVMVVGGGWMLLFYYYGRPGSRFAVWREGGLKTDQVEPGCLEGRGWRADVLRGSRRDVALWLLDGRRYKGINVHNW